MQFLEIVDYVPQSKHLWLCRLLMTIHKWTVLFFLSQCYKYGGRFIYLLSGGCGYISFYYFYKS